MTLVKIDFLYGIKSFYAFLALLMYGPRLLIFFDLFRISKRVLTLLSYNLASGRLIKLKVLSDLNVCFSTSLN